MLQSNITMSFEYQDRLMSCNAAHTQSCGICALT